MDHRRRVEAGGPCGAVTRDREGGGFRVDIGVQWRQVLAGVVLVSARAGIEQGVLERWGW